MNKEKLKKINEINFEYIDPPKSNDHKIGTMRIGSADIEAMPNSHEENQGILRERIIELFDSRLGGKATKVYEVCDIDRTNFTRYTKGHYGITKQNLIKFIIGLGLDLSEAKELLDLNGTPLNSRVCRFDYIAELAITDGDALDDFLEELVEYGCSDISSKTVR